MRNRSPWLRAKAILNLGRVTTHRTGDEPQLVAPQNYASAHQAHRQSAHSSNSRR